MTKTKDEIDHREKYPNCYKLADRGKEWNMIFPFLEWLGEHGIELCRYCEENDIDNDIAGGFLLIGKSKTTLLHEYFGVDITALEQERRALLELMREMNKPKPGGK